MPSTNPYDIKTGVQENYDPRWFIWTIVFLVVTGISLVSYISLSDSGINDTDYSLPVRASLHKAVTATSSGVTSSTTQDN